jgi:UDP-N-acetylglucosamine:LPS N-acetylglucosamine transferase
MTTTVDLIYFNAGGGHRASALALQTAIRDLGWDWDVRLVNLFEVLDPRDMVKRVLHMRPEDFYNKRLAHGWTMGMTQELKLLQASIRLGHKAMVKRLRGHWEATRPDLVVSLVPNFNRAMYESLEQTLPGVTYVTIMTDLADYPPHFWMEPGQLTHMVCGSPRAVEQALEIGYDERRIHATSGMVMRPDFYRPPLADRAAERSKVGLDPDLPTALVMFGGHGSKSMLRIAAKLPDTQLILMCGHNKKLADKLRALPSAAPRLVVGFTSEIPYYMQMADFFIGKPGPGSISEAVRQGLPVIVVSNLATMPQERYNAHWVRDNGVGMVLSSFRGIRHAAGRMVQDLAGYRANVARIDNRAVFEIPYILARILGEPRRNESSMQSSNTEACTYTAALNPPR